MIDYFFKFTDEATALASAIAASQKFAVNGAWLQDHVLPNVTAVRISTGVPFTGWFAIVSTVGQVPLLLNAAALQFALDRDACAINQPFVVKNNIGALITDVRVSPIFAGSTYPIGGGFN